MNAPSFRLLAGAAVLLAATSGHCATYPLDDSASQVVPPNARWQWAQGSLRTGINTLEMNVRVNVRIDTRAWAGKASRIYMVLPLEGSSPVTAQWQAQGRLQGGRMVSGERALVFTGVVPGPLLEDTLQVRLTTDARLLREEVRRLAFHFELENP